MTALPKASKQGRRGGKHLCPGTDHLTEGSGRPHCERGIWGMTGSMVEWNNTGLGIQETESEF